jgi:hypothetical protein
MLSIVSQLNPIHITTFQFLKIYFNNIPTERHGRVINTPVRIREALGSTLRPENCYPV